MKYYVNFPEIITNIYSVNKALFCNLTSPFRFSTTLKTKYSIIDLDSYYQSPYPSVPYYSQKKTSMHSSGMRTARLLTVSQYALHRGCESQHALGRGLCIPACTWQGGVCPGGVCWGVSSQGVFPWGCLPGGCGRHPRDQRQTPPSCEQND